MRWHWSPENLWLHCWRGAFKEYEKESGQYLENFGIWSFLEMIILPWVRRESFGFHVAFVYVNLDEDT